VYDGIFAFFVSLVSESCFLFSFALSVSCFMMASRSHAGNFFCRAPAASVVASQDQVTR